MKKEYDNITEIISTNIKKFREALNLTQAELGEKLNYSDKTLSKWERGESIPDIVTLKQLADIFNISVDELINEEGYNSFIKHQNNKKPLSRKTVISITILSLCIVYVVAAISFSLCMIYKVNSIYFKPWYSFIIALPISCIILLVYSCIWGNRYTTFISTSFLIWSVALTIHIILHFVDKIFFVYIVPIPLEIMALVFFLVLKSKKKDKN